LFALLAYPDEVHVHEPGFVSPGNHVPEAAPHLAKAQQIYHQHQNLQDHLNTGIRVQIRDEVRQPGEAQNLEETQTVK